VNVLTVNEEDRTQDKSAPFPSPIYRSGSIAFAPWAAQRTQPLMPQANYLLDVEQTGNIFPFEEGFTLDFEMEWAKAEKGGKPGWETFIRRISDLAVLYGADRLYKKAIQFALLHDALKLARQLADAGLKRYPESEELKRYVVVLAPPRVIETGKRSGRDFSKSMRWLSAYSHEYVGQWVALQDGELLGTAATRKQLEELIGDLASAPNVLLSRIPVT